MSVADLPLVPGLGQFEGDETGASFWDALQNTLLLTLWIKRKLLNEDSNRKHPFLPLL